MGRPSKFTPQILDEICARLSEGEPLRQICRSEGMPSWDAVYRWMAGDEKISQRIARARELGHDAISEQCIEIADNEKHDWIVTKKGEVTNEVAISRARLQVETRLKLLAKWNPKKFGDRAGDGGGQTSISVFISAGNLPALQGGYRELQEAHGRN